MSGLGVPGWQFGIDDLTTEVACGTGNHTIAWRRGKLVLCDHDLAAEAATLAFGGPPPRCVQVLQAWRRARRHARFVKVDDETISYFRAKNLPLGEQFQAALLPEPLRDLRERTTWLHALRAGDDLQKRRRDSVMKAIRRRAEAALDRVVDPLRVSMEIASSARLLPRGAPPRALGRPGGGHIQMAEVFLPPEWLSTVALLDLTAVDGCFVLAVAAPTGSVDDLDAMLLDWRCTRTGRLAANVTTARVQRADGSWHRA